MRQFHLRIEFASDNRFFLLLSRLTRAAVIYPLASGRHWPRGAKEAEMPRHTDAEWDVATARVLRGHERQASGAQNQGPFYLIRLVFQ